MKCSGCEFHRARSNAKPGVKIHGEFGKCIRQGGVCDPTKVFGKAGEQDRKDWDVNPPPRWQPYLHQGWWRIMDPTGRTHPIKPFLDEKKAQEYCEKKNLEEPVKSKKTEIVKSPDDALEEIAVALEEHAKATLRNIVEAGKILVKAREIFGDDDKGFGQWREKRLPWLSRATSLRWMQVAEEFGKNLLHHRDAVEISPKALYLLAAPSTPEPAKREAKERISSGKGLSTKEAREIKEKHTPKPPEPPKEEPPIRTQDKYPDGPWNRYPPVPPPDPQKIAMGIFDPHPDPMSVPENYHFGDFEEDTIGKLQTAFRTQLAIMLNKFHHESRMNVHDVCRFNLSLAEDFIHLQEARLYPQKPQKGS